jgi:hypothetical protein
MSLVAMMLAAPQAGLLYLSVCISLKGELPEQAAQMALVMAPSPDRSMVKGLAHLPTARGLHDAHGAMEIEAGRFPCETEKINESPAQPITGSL